MAATMHITSAAMNTMAIASMNGPAATFSRWWSPVTVVAPTDAIAFATLASAP